MWQDRLQLLQTNLDLPSLVPVFDSVLNTLPDDIERARHHCSHLFQDEFNDIGIIQKNINFLQSLCVGTTKRFSIPALCIIAIESLNIKDERWQNLILTAALAAEIPLQSAYHNNTHFFKVVFQAICILAICKKHTDLPFNLDERDMAMVLVGACIHDLGHDGGDHYKTIMEGAAQDYPHVMEEKAFQSGILFLEEAGLDDETVKAILHLMVLCTDVQGYEGKDSPSTQVRAAYKFHYPVSKSETRMEKISPAALIEPEFSALIEDPKLCVLALILHEADIATSAGMNYSITQEETRLLAKEWGDEPPKPSQIVRFLEDICELEMVSPPAQILYSENLKDIYQQVLNDIHEGDQPF